MQFKGLVGIFNHNKHNKQKFSISLEYKFKRCSFMIFQLWKQHKH